MEDLRLRDIESLIDSGRYDLLSVDLFDTLLWRAVPAPRDVFYLVGSELLERGWVHDSSSPSSFVKERAGAETRARQRKRSGEVNLAEIYAEFPRGYLRGTTPSAVAALEFEIERRIVRVDAGMHAVVERARRRGLAIAFVSDTYFTTPQIAALAPVGADYILLSNEQNRSKAQGLHQLLLNTSGIEPGRVLHVGNDYQADIDGPGVLGIERYWYRQWPECYAELPGLELPAVLSRREALLRCGDAGLTALRTRVLHTTADPYERWGAAILGPIVSGFCDWVAARCGALDISLALCLMREGRIFKRVLDLQNSGLKTGEFYVSRFIARKAAIFDGTEAELGAFVLRPSPQEKSRMLQQLGLAAENVGGGDPAALLAPRDAIALIRRICADQGLRRRVVAASAEARQNLLAHLDTLLPHCAAGSRIALVDLGYKGTIQECLQRIFDRERPELKSHGLYLVTGGDVFETQATGAPAEGWLAENGQPIAMAHTFMRSPEIVEQSLMAPVGTCIGHAPSGEPVLDALHVPADQLAQIAAIQRGVLIHAEAWRRHREDMPLPDAGQLRALYQAICIRAVARPLPVELELFSGWHHDENFGAATARGLCEIVGVADWELSHMSPHQLASLPASRLYWPCGLAHRLHPAMGEAVANIFLRTADPAVFDAAHDTQYLVAYWDTGDGFNREQASIHPYRLNNRGRVWQRFNLGHKGTPARRLGLSVGLRDQVLSLAGVAVHGHADHGRSFTRRLPHEIVEKLGYRHLGRNLYQVDADAPLLVVPLEDVPADTRQVDVDIFFGLVIEG